MKHNDCCSTLKYNRKALDSEFPEIEDFPKTINNSLYRSICGYEDPDCDCSYCLGCRGDKKSWKHYRKTQWK